MPDEERTAADRYRLIWASYVGARDGFALELQDETGEGVAEVFRDDDREGALTFNTFTEISVPLQTIRWMLDVAAREMPPHKPDETLDL